MIFWGKFIRSPSPSARSRTIQIANGTVQMANGNMQIANGTVQNANGKKLLIRFPEGWWVRSNFPP